SRHLQSWLYAVLSADGAPSLHRRDARPTLDGPSDETSGASRAGTSRHARRTGGDWAQEDGQKSGSTVAESSGCRRRSVHVAASARPCGLAEIARGAFY